MNPANEQQREFSSQQGFTLIEASIAMVLLAIVGLGIALVFGYAAKNTSNAADREMAAAVAQQKFEQLRSVVFNDPVLAATPSQGTMVTVTTAGREFTINTTIVDSAVVNGNATVKTITVTAAPRSSSAPWATSGSNLFGSVTLVSQRVASLIGPNRAL